ncbi:MAG: DUF2953 domain-containing protein [Oscillospiraceae bacterium]|nr:DUF2953 domain-containing protein [Oscillospiraceae bacterium]
MTGWIVLGVILLLLAAIALLKVGVWLEYSAEGFVLKAKVGPFAIRILPRPPKKEGKQKPPERKKPPKPPTPAKEPEAPKPKRGGLPTLALRLIPILSEAAGRFRRKLVIERLWLSFTAGGSADPAAAAILYGRISAAMGTLAPLLENSFQLKDRRFHSGADFTAERAALYLHAVLTIRVGQIIALAFRCGWKCLRVYLAWRKEYPKPKPPKSKPPNPEPVKPVSQGTER